MNVEFNPIMMDYIKDLFDLREKLLSDDDLENYQELKERYDFLAGIVLSRVLEIYEDSEMKR